MNAETTTFFYTTASGRGGPVQLSELRSLAVAGKLTRQDKVWSDGMDEWQAAGAIPKLFEGLPPDILVQESQSTSTASPRIVPVIEATSKAGVALREISSRFNLKSTSRVAVVVLIAVVALEVVTGMFGIRWRLNEVVREHTIVSVLAFVLVAGIVFKSRMVLVRFVKFTFSTDRQMTVDNSKQPRWAALLQGRAGVLLLLLVCLVVGLGWNTVTKVRAREKWERERPQREAEQLARRIGIAENEGFRSGQMVAEASTVTGGHRIARTEAAIRIVAQEAMNVPPYRPMLSQKWSGDEWSAWKDGFVAGYADYMRKRQRPAW